MVMFIHASKLACLNLPARLVCPAGRRKGIKSRMLPIDEPSVQQTQDDVLVGQESVQSVKSVKSVVKIRTTSALVPGGHYFE